MDKSKLHSLILSSLHVEASSEIQALYLALCEKEWGYLIEKAIHLRLAYVFDRFLIKNPAIASVAPQSCLDELKRHQRQTLFINLMRQAQLRKLLDALSSEGIPCLLMKGLWVVEILYGDLRARQSGDIDLLLKPEDMPRFTRLVQRLGYGIDPTIADIRDVALMNNEFHLSDPTGRVEFDIHWSLTHPTYEASIDESQLWVRAKNYSIAGRDCLSFDYEDHLLLLFFHAAEHHRFRYVGLRSLMDIGQALDHSSPPIDWDLLQKRATTLGWERGVFLMMGLAQDVLGVDVPEKLQHKTNDKEWKELKKTALQVLIEDQDDRTCIGVEVVALLNERTLFARLRHAKNRLFISRKQLKGYFLIPSTQPISPVTLIRLHFRRWGVIFNANFSALYALWREDPKKKMELERSTRIQMWFKSK